MKPKKINGIVRFFVIFSLTVMLIPCANGQKNANGEYYDWPKWEGARTKWIGAYMLQLRKTISFQEYQWLYNLSHRAWRIPEECSKAIELKARLYRFVPSGCNYCKTTKEKNEQKEVNLRYLWRACEFDWQLNSFIKKCHKEIEARKKKEAAAHPKSGNNTAALPAGNQGGANTHPSNASQAMVTGLPVDKNNHLSGSPKIDFLIKSYPVNNSTSLSASIDRDLSSGVSPVGLNFSGNTLQLLYLSPDVFGVKSWCIEYYKTAEEISAGITSKMQDEGMLPMGLTSDNTGLSFLFIKGDAVGAAWQLVESKQDLTEVSKNISPYLKQGYFPVGITLHGNSYYTLLIKVNGNQFKSWEIIGYQDVSRMKREMQQNISQNILPFGFLESNGVYNILYVGL